MKFSPITEEQARESSKPNYLLKPGECDFEVRRAEDARSEKGNEMIKLTLDVWDADNKKATVFDYLLDAIPHKLRHAAYACGLGHLYEAGNIEAANFEGKGGRLLIRNKQQPGYDPKNEVADYMLSERTKETTGYKRAKAQDAGNSAAPPSARLEAWQKFQRQNAGKHTDELAKLWRDELRAYFGEKPQAQISDLEWRNFSNRQTVANPISQTPEFDVDSIPF